MVANAAEIIMSKAIITKGHLEKLLPLAIADSSGVNVNESERERSGIIRGQFYGVWRGGAIFRGALMRSPYLSDKFFPYKPDQDYYVLLKSSDQGQEYSGFPIHPGHLQKCTFGEGDAPDFVEVGEAGIAMDDAMRRQRRVQLVG